MVGVYRKPSSSTEENEPLVDYLRCKVAKNQSFLLLRHFRLPKVDWNAGKVQKVCLTKSSLAYFMGRTWRSKFASLHKGGRGAY